MTKQEAINYPVAGARFKTDKLDRTIKFVGENTVVCWPHPAIFGGAEVLSKADFRVWAQGAQFIAPGVAV